MADKHSETRIREARLIVASPENVYAELQKYNEDLKDDWWSSDKPLEESLFARGDLLIDLGLARFARECKIVAALYKKSHAAPKDRKPLAKSSCSTELR